MCLAYRVGWLLLFLRTDLGAAEEATCDAQLLFQARTSSRPVPVTPTCRSTKDEGWVQNSRVLLFWAVGKNPSVIDLVMQNVVHARSNFSSLHFDVYLNHYDQNKDAWLERSGEWYAEHVNFSSSLEGIKFYVARKLFFKDAPMLTKNEVSFATDQLEGTPKVDVASYEWLWFLDEDADFRNTDLQLMIEDARASEALIVTPSIIFEKDPVRQTRTASLPAAPRRARTARAVRHRPVRSESNATEEPNSTEAAVNTTEAAVNTTEAAVNATKAELDAKALAARAAELNRRRADMRRRWEMRHKIHWRASPAKSADEEIRSNATSPIRMLHGGAAVSCQARDANCQLQFPSQNCKYRHTSFVEVSFPIMRPQAFKLTAGTCAYCLHSESVWGLDRVWCGLAAKSTCSDRTNACAVLDRTNITHRNFRTLPKYDRKYSVNASIQNREAERRVVRQYTGLNGGLHQYDCTPLAEATLA